MNWAVSKMTDFERFVRNGLARDSCAPGKFWKELSQEVDDLVDFKAWAQGKIEQLEANMMGCLEAVEDKVAFSTPVTLQKVKRTLKNDFDEYERTEGALRKVKPKVSRKVRECRGVDDGDAREDDDVIEVETYKGNVAFVIFLPVM